MPEFKDFTVERFDKKENLIEENELRQWEADSGVIRANVKDIFAHQKDTFRVRVLQGSKLIHEFERGEDGKPVEVAAE